MLRNSATEAKVEPNKTERIANRNKRYILIASIVFPPLGYLLVGKRKYALICLFTFGYFLLGFLVVPVHTRVLINRARRITNEDAIEQKSYHRQYGTCPDCGEQMLRICGLRSVVCESCGARHSTKNVEYLGMLQSLSSSETQPSMPDIEDTQVSDRSNQFDTDSDLDNLDKSEISERVDRIEGESKPAFGIVAGLSLMGFGALLSITGIGAIIGLPMVGIGLFIVVGGSVGQAGKTAKKSMNESIWKGTELEQKIPGVVRHRKVNKKFGGRCVVCGEFASLRDQSGHGISDEVQCKECSARLKREEPEGWRLIEGDDERVGERKEIEQWKDELRERDLRKAD